VYYGPRFVKSAVEKLNPVTIAHQLVEIDAKPAYQEESTYVY